MLSRFFDMADRKRKIANSFRNTSYENKLSKVDQERGNFCPKREKKNYKIFHCNDIAQIIIEIYVFSRRQIFAIKKSLLQFFSEKDSFNPLVPGVH